MKLSWAVATDVWAFGVPKSQQLGSVGKGGSNTSKQLDVRLLPWSICSAGVEHSED